MVVARAQFSFSETTMLERTMNEWKRREKISKKKKQATKANEQEENKNKNFYSKSEEHWTENSEHIIFLRRNLFNLCSS